MRLRRLAARDADPHEYLDGANTAFGGWGDLAMFAWVFRDDAELFFLDDATGRPVAASGITWRRLRDGQRAAIMTGSWTLAAARGQGAFTRMLDATRAAAEERGAAVLAFVRSENPSRRRLAAAGAGMHPSFYCRSTKTPEIAVDLDILEPDPASFPTGFLYTPAQWRTQFVERSDAHIECVGQRGAWSAVVERAAEFDRVHLVSDDAALPHLTARAHAAGRRLFWYATRPPAMECEWTDGFLASLPVTVISGAFQNGDRM